MIVSVGLIEGVPAAEVELLGEFLDEGAGRRVSGALSLAAPRTLTPLEPASAAFALPDVTIGIGFHWERKERQVFRGALRAVAATNGLTLIDDVPLEEYVTSVISSEMSATSPLELLKAHAVISRSWLLGSRPTGAPREEDRGAGEVRRWYGREAHPRFDVCADDHCQRYQGITKAISPAAAEAVAATRGEMLRYEGAVCDARFSKCCGGITEVFATAWEDREVPYLPSVLDGAAARPADLDAWIREDPPASCNTRDAALLARVLPGFDQETRDFHRWTVRYGRAELGSLVASRLGVELGPISALEPLARGPSGRIHRLRITGERGTVVVGKELELRRALSTSHLRSSAFVVDREPDAFLLRGAGWGHGVGLCQIGAAVLADQGIGYREILGRYAPGAMVRA